MARRKLAPTPVGAPTESSGPGIGTALLSALGIGAGALLLKNPGLLRTLAGKAQNVRLASMLSGFAVPKSIAGNIGAAAVSGAERGTMEPLRELLSMKTLRDVGRHWREGGGYGQYEAAPKYSPARLMSAFDRASSGAMERAGVAPLEAQRYLLQSPLDPKFSKALENPVSKFLVPFRRTPMNQFTEGMSTLSGRHPKVLAAAAGAGALMGANDADPVTIGLTAPFASTYALPYVGSAALTKYLLSNKRPTERFSHAARTLQGVAPVSEYGIASSLFEPFKPFTELAAVKAYRKR